ncbi:YceI family protein [Lysobacter sp. F6437]|uniref:YceI family protein n=1 Tax=Lysobacter sp. F6437 TaxID=3459296 RepID=UPI00403E2DF9
MAVTFKQHWLAWGVVGALAWPAFAAAPASMPFAAPDFRPGDSIGFDPVHTRFGFELRTRWGQRVDGRFPNHDGALEILPDGRHQVRIRLMTAAVEVEGSERYAELARGERFFDAANYPVIEFVSEPHPAELAHDGGKLRGRLSMHGVSRIETFVVAPATCARPGRDCDVVASGSVDRDDYGLDHWRLALTDKVSFDMRVRLQDAPR